MVSCHCQFTEGHCQFFESSIGDCCHCQCPREIGHCHWDVATCPEEFVVCHCHTSVVNDCCHISCPLLILIGVGSKTQVAFFGLLQEQTSSTRDVTFRVAL